MDGFLDYHTVMQLEQYCQQLYKWGEIHYVKAFMLLLNRISPETEVRLLVQRRQGTLKPLPGSTQEKKETRTWASLMPDLRGQKIHSRRTTSIVTPTASYP